MIEIRMRRDEDLPALEAALTEQQPVTGYPQTPPGLAMTFLRRDGELAAFSALIDGAPVGHVSVLSAVGMDHGDGGAVTAAWCEAHGLPPERLGVLSAIFVGLAGRGHRLGHRLMEAAEQWCAANGYAPCLDSQPLPRSGAARLYRERGWVLVAQVDATWREEGSPLIDVMVLPAEVVAERFE